MRKTIGVYIRKRSIPDLRRNFERLHCTSSRQWWWEQPFDADLEREEDAYSIVSEDASEAGSLTSMDDSAYRSSKTFKCGD